MLFRLVALLVVAVQAHAAEPPFQTEKAFPGIRLDQPVAIVSPPGEHERIFVVEKAGRILVFNARTPSAQAAVFLDLRKEVGDSGGEQGLLALAFHPNWTSNRQFFIWYTSTDRNARGGREDRLARFLISASNANEADPASRAVLIAQADEASNHNGGELQFGPDGYLYVSLGDEGGADDSFRNSQRIDRDFFSGILRLDVDHRPGSLAPNSHPAVTKGEYSVPPDNPFVGLTEFNGARLNSARVRTEFWAVGLRNPWRMSFDSETGWLWCGDVGQNRLEEVDLITRGGNYGWNYREAGERFRGRPPTGTTFVEPIWSYPRAEGVSITGGLVYRGNRFPELDGKYLFADFASGKLWGLEPNGDKAVTAARIKHIANVPSVASFGRDPQNGDVLLASLSSSQLLRLVRVPGK